MPCFGEPSENSLPIAEAFCSKLPNSGEEEDIWKPSRRVCFKVCARVWGSEE
jgi:hypothetical protein